MTVRIVLQPAYILHTRSYRDTSLLVDLLCLDHGLIRAVARGARGSRSGKRALLQPLQPLLISLSGSGELLTLTDAEHAAPAFHFIGERLFSVMYINELLVRLLHGQDAHPRIYQLYQLALLNLQHDGDLESVLRRFEWSLLDELGYAPDLEHDALTGLPLDASGCYLFDPDQGLAQILRPTGPWPANLFQGKDLAALAKLVADERQWLVDHDTRVSVKRLTRQALQPHLGNKPLLSRALFAGKGPRLPPEDNTG